MVFTLYFLFILVMTHALVALPFSGPGYYGHNFFKHGKRVPEFGKALVHKAVSVYPLIYPEISTSDKSHFKTGHPFWYMPYLSKHAKYPSTALPLDKPTSKEKRFYDIVPRGKPFYDLFSSYKYFKPSSIPKSSYIPFPMPVPDTKSSHGTSKVSDTNLSNSKPKILFIKGIKEPFHDQRQFTAEEIIVAPNTVAGEAGPTPNSNNDILAIDIVAAENETPPKEMNPVNSVEFFNMFSVPVGGPSNPNDPRRNVVIDNPLLESIAPDTPGSVDSLTGDANTQLADKPEPGVTGNTVVGFPAVHISGAHSKVAAAPTNDVVAGVDNAGVDNAVVTIGDIPGFVVDGGSTSGAISFPTYIIPETPRQNQVINVFNINDVSVNQPGTTGVVKTNIDLGLNSNGNPPLLTSSGTNFDFTEVGHVDNLEGFGNNAGFTNPDIGSDLVIAENQDRGLEANLLTDIQNDRSVLGSITTSTVQPANAVISKVNSNIHAKILPSVDTDNNAVIPEGDAINAPVMGALSPEEDQNNLNIGSVVIIRPVSFLMNIEPFGPGPYGQCRAPSRVVCGVRFGWEHVTGMAEWCKRNCVVFMYSSYCDDNRCQCECT